MFAELLLLGITWRLMTAHSSHVPPVCYSQFASGFLQAVNRIKRAELLPSHDMEVDDSTSTPLVTEATSKLLWEAFFSWAESTPEGTA